jgi:hypothetical protein
LKRRTHGITTELCTGPTPTPRRRLSNVSEDLSTLLRRFGASFRAEGRGAVGGGRFFRGIFSRAVECKRRSRNVNLTTLPRKGEGICLRALNALRERRPSRAAREYICTRVYTPVLAAAAARIPPDKAAGAFKQFFGTPIRGRYSPADSSPPPASILANPPGPAVGSFGEGG